MWFDEQLEFGNAGLIEYPLEFIRNDIVYGPSVFSVYTEQELKALGIYPALDVTRQVDPKEVKESAYTYVRVADVFEITFDIGTVTTTAIEQGQQDSMFEAGKAKTLDNDARTSVGAAPSIADTTAHNAWMQTLYANADADVVSSIPKPPADERQEYNISYQNNDVYEFTRYQDQWGWRWKLDLKRDSVNALAIAIYNSGGTYLYTTGGLIRNAEDDGWYTECPAGQADATPEDVYYKWLLGSADISGLQVYKGTDDTTTGKVKSDSDYD